MKAFGLLRDVRVAHRWLVALCALLVGALDSSPALAQPAPATDRASESAEEAQRESPRAAVQRFLELARKRRFVEAGRLTVESLGLRSTTIRTLDRTLVSFPNGKLAEMRLETFAARDRLRLACTVGIVYETTEAQMRAVLAGLERTLREHPKIWPDVVTVRLKELAASSLDIEVMAWFATSDWGEFQAIRQDILLSFMSVVEAAGTSFAFPTRTVHVVGASSP